MSKEMVKAVKQALREIEEEKIHAQVHGKINLELMKETPEGKVGMAKCGVCKQIIEYRAFTPLTPPQ